LAKDRAGDPQILACLGRVWLLKGKQDKSSLWMKNSLDYSSRALAIAPNQIHFKFNIAFVQIQLAQLMYTLPEGQRTLAEVQAASEGLDEAIESFTAIAQSKNPPYPKHDIEQRANMGRNTMRRQLERAVQAQREYEEKNAAKLQEARDTREAELRRREEERRRAEEIAEEQRRKIAQERYKMLEMSRELAEKRAEEERRKEELEYTEDEETGERVKRKKTKKGGKRKKKGEDTDTDGDGEVVRKGGKSTENSSAVGSDDGEKGRVTKKRKLLRKRGEGKVSNYKSSELVVDSDSDGANEIAPAKPVTNGSAPVDKQEEEDPDTRMADPDDEDEDEDEAIVKQPRKNASRRIADDDDEDEEEGWESETLAQSNNPGEEAEEEEGKKANVFADPPNISMVDETVGAAGDEDTAEYGPTGGFT